MDENGRNILLLVEGVKDEVKLFKQIILCFPEIKLNLDNILVHNTNLWALNKKLERAFGENWYELDEFSFREYLAAEYPKIQGKKITDIFLVFDYERQDPLFDGVKLEQICSFFTDSVENGQIYINYPMIESYKHLNVLPLPDDSYRDRICRNSDISNYKELVGHESKYQDVRKLNRLIIQQITAHNIKKISYMLTGNYNLDEAGILSFYDEIDLETVLKLQNEFSSSADESIYVLCTCVLLIANYNKKLLFDQ